MVAKEARTKSFHIWGKFHCSTDSINRLYMMVLKKLTFIFFLERRRRCRNWKDVCKIARNIMHVCIFLFFFFPFWSSRGPVNLIKLFVRPYLMPFYNWPCINPNFVEATEIHTSTLLSSINVSWFMWLVLQLDSRRGREMNSNPISSSVCLKLFQ